jgi:hypothetical protein
MGPQGTPASTPPHWTPIFEHDLGSERGIMRWGLRDDGCPWCCSQWRSAPSPAAPPPARFPATRAGDFSRARAGIDQKIVAFRARSEGRLKSNAGNDQHIDDEMFGATVAQGRLRAAECRRSRHARLRLSKTCSEGSRRRRSKTPLPPSSPRAPRRGARAIGDDLALTRAESASANLCAAWRINSGATVFREKRLTLKFA